MRDDSEVKSNHAELVKKRPASLTAGRVIFCVSGRNLGATRGTVAERPARALVYIAWLATLAAFPHDIGALMPEHDAAAF